MGNSQSILSYPDVRDVMDRALESEKGVRLQYDSVRAAQAFIFRAYTFRSLDRKENTKIYQEPTHSLHGRSVYDTLQIKRRDTTIEVVPVRPFANVEIIE